MSLNRPVLGLSLAIGYCLSTSIAFVGSLYFLVPSHIRQLDRDHPSQIKWRSFATGCVCVAALAGQAYLLGTNEEKTAPIEPLVTNFYPQSVQHTLLSSAKVLAHVAVLYTGSILDTFLLVWAYMTKHRASRPPTTLEYLKSLYSFCLEPHVRSLTFANSGGWMAWRNVIIAPVLEEVAFRVGMVPILLAAGMRPVTVYWTAPLFFGVAHAHHAAQRLRQGTLPAIVIAQTTFQFSYTTLFGAYAAYIYVHTRSATAIAIAHGFCNLMGLPNFQFFQRKHDLFKYRWALLSAHFFGLTCFIGVLVQGLLTSGQD